MQNRKLRSYYCLGAHIPVKKKDKNAVFRERERGSSYKREGGKEGREGGKEGREE